LRILGIETATKVCSVGLAVDTQFVSEHRLLQEYRHAEQLSEMVNAVVREGGMDIEALDGIAVSIGPGSFTGLRIGLGLAKGLAFGLQKPLFAIPTMDGLVSQIPLVFEYACIMIVARKGEVYRGIYEQVCDSWKLIGEYEVISEVNLLKNLPEAEVVFTGDGIPLYHALLTKKIRSRFLPPYMSLPSGYYIAVAGDQKIREGNVSDIDSLVPLYLKRFQGMA
jgi:tRNA threonylcarbamoyladenosine biosynthesis protein TsaB